MRLRLTERRDMSEHDDVVTQLTKDMQMLARRPWRRANGMQIRVVLSDLMSSDGFLLRCSFVLRFVAKLTCDVPVRGSRRKRTDAGRYVMSYNVVKQGA